ncbi:unnamed protein product [Boreogadus saida]
MEETTCKNREPELWSRRGDLNLQPGTVAIDPLEGPCSMRGASNRALHHVSSRVGVIPSTARPPVSSTARGPLWDTVIEGTSPGPHLTFPPVEGPSLRHCGSVCGGGLVQKDTSVRLWCLFRFIAKFAVNTGYMAWRGCHLGELRSAYGEGGSNLLHVDCSMCSRQATRASAPELARVPAIVQNPQMR